jgi:hypothetical protein
MLPQRHFSPARSSAGPAETGVRSPAAARPATASADSIWQSVFWFILEGFALYGASVHWVATTAITAIASEVDARHRQQPAGRERRKSISLVPPAARAEAAVLGREDAIEGTGSETRLASRRVGFASGGREVDRYRFVHHGWLATVWRAITSRWVMWRREREVRKVVADLAEYDDRTLRDMGIVHRSRIEQTVRGGRNG